MDELGRLNVVVFARPDQEPAFWFELPDASLEAAILLERKVMDIALTDLLKNPALEWQFEHAGHPRSGKNHSPENMIEGVDTFYLGSVAADEGEAIAAAQGEVGGLVAATAVLMDPALNATCAVSPLAQYELTMLAAVQRCEGRIVASFLSAEGEVLRQESWPISSSHRGGVSVEDYQKLSLLLVAPAASATLTITIEKGPTLRRDTSYVFFAKVALQQQRKADAAPSYAPPGRFRDLSALQGMVAISARLARPRGLRAGPVGLVKLHLDLQGSVEILEDVEFPEQATAPQVTQFDVSHRQIRIAGRLAPGSLSSLNLGAFVDGELSITGHAQIADGTFTVELYLSAKHMDGMLHLIELRQLPEEIPLAAQVEILPAYMTPWPALQLHAGQPLDINASPAARFHFQSYRDWAAHSGEPVWRAPPDLALLHDELLTGFRKRREYPVLRVPQADAPRVSIVIPIHDKFEVTYNCVASLLFAFDPTSFEIILVDDGSTDESASLETFLPGVRVVRHSAALGFVASCNDGAQIARGEFICFLNNDTEVTPNWLAELLLVFENFDGVGLVGSKLLYPDGRLQEAGGIVWGSGNPWNVGRNGNAQDPRYNYVRQVDYLSGAAILLRRDLWSALGGFSAEFAPGYFEDTDLAMKVRQAGLKVVYVPTSQVFHHEGQSSGTTVTSGMKRFQEINRPKFKRKWAQLFAGHGVEGVAPDREKDRNVTLRVLFVDHRFPAVDADAGGYAAFQEIRLLQACGAKVSFLPRNLAYMDRHVLALQRIGVECLYAPFVTSFGRYIEQSAHEYDLVYVTRYSVAQDLLPALREHAPAVRVAFCLADLHFLREAREAALGSDAYSFEGARATREAELAMVRASDVTLSYSETELAVLESHLFGEAKLAKLPWVVDVNEAALPRFAETSGLLFVGGFRHPPNIAAVEFLARHVMPLLAERAPDIILSIVGSNPPPSIQALDGGNIRVIGYVPSLDPVFQQARVFVAPLMAGAGMKGKVLEAISRGVPSVLSTIAAEGIGLTAGHDCWLARTAEEWASAIERLHADEAEWRRVQANAAELARSRFSFQQGHEMTREWMAKIDLYDRARSALVYRHCRPVSYGR
ncbi:glycosyltransferase [Sediminicoccus sp. KRV36]|uniref:glycosyltransferase n=1 Tax=Sediminicoccus sp. KRV36 TaxID=3133721 RepID=UPI00200D072D|nr:glycosyltransferase [Sediminicoccus rosea]UPY35935.1 glycosyltransferase [Sediminicoccus rosea]